MSSLSIPDAVPARRTLGALDPTQEEVLVATRLHALCVASSARSLLMLSVSPSSSASLVVADTARVLTHIKAPVLVIDIYNKARPKGSVPELLNHLTCVNVTDLVDGRRMDFVRDGDSCGIVVAQICQEPDPLGFLSSEQFLSFLQKSKNLFSYILIDSPSQQESGTGLILAPHCDGCVLLVEQGVSLYGDMEETKKQLLQAGASLLGFVYQRRGKGLKRSSR